MARLAAPRHLPRRFDPVAAMPEREVDGALAAGLSCSDPATVRREMVEAGLLRRDPAGRSYRLAAPDVPPDAPPGEVTT